MSIISIDFDKPVPRGIKRGTIACHVNGRYYVAKGGKWVRSTPSGNTSFEEIKKHIGKKAMEFAEAAHALGLD